MSFPFEYDHGTPHAFGGALPEPRNFEESRVVILPVPVEPVNEIRRTSS